MPEPRREESDDPEASADEALSGDALDLDGLRARGDVSGLLALARAYRSGGAPGGRDMARCFEAYRVAAELGSADAEYAVALFCMTGGVVAQDLKEGAARLRAAADKGSVPAKVYVGNLYELGIHYKADPEKADVWYRNAARGAGIDASPGSAEYAEALAELGCARYVLALVESGAVDGDDRARLLQRARAHGYGLRMKDANAGDRPTFLDSLQRADESLQRADEDASPASAHDPGRPARQRATTTPDTKAARAAAGAQAGRG
ncbi:MAG: sel1 repeat family protein, partial [Labilithrix sp.]|nr:sel1 repeat family protein [Labilithrix sp.]